LEVQVTLQAPGTALLRSQTVDAPGHPLLSVQPVHAPLTQYSWKPPLVKHCELEVHALEHDPGVAPLHTVPAPGHPLPLRQPVHEPPTQYSPEKQSLFVAQAWPQEPCVTPLHVAPETPWGHWLFAKQPLQTPPTHVSPE
jgi:hypothetical protein